MIAVIRTPRSPAIQLGIAFLLVATFVFGRWAIVGEGFGGGFVQCAPVTLLAVLLLSRVFALLAIAGALGSSFVLYLHPAAGGDNGVLYLSILGVCTSVAIVGGVTLWLMREVEHANALIAHLASRNSQLLAQSECAARVPRAVLAGAPAINGPAMADPAILPDLAQSTLSPCDRGGRIAVRLPRAHVPHETVIPLAMALQGLAAASLRTGALADDDGRVRLSGTLHEDGSLDLDWRETGSLAGSSAHLTAIEGDMPSVSQSFRATEAHAAPGQYSCRIVIADARPG